MPCLFHSPSLSLLFFIPFFLIFASHISHIIGLTVEDATSLLGVAARMRITPVVKDLVNMWKSDTGAAKREDKVTD